jgi:uncharacterized protein involved in outer membrane biogenesis
MVQIRKRSLLPMPKVARIFLFILVGLILAGCLLVLLAWLFIDSDDFKGHLEKTASQALGMKAEVQGSSRVLLWPVPGLRFEDFCISKGDSEWLKASALEVRVRIMPMIRGRLELASLDLVEPNLRLERIEKEIFNFIPDHEPGDSGQAQPLTIRSFKVSDLNLSFTDQISDKRITVENCDWTGHDLEWSPSQADRPQLNLPDFHSNLTCSQITSSNLEATGVKAKISGQSQQIMISQVTGRLLGGEFAGWMKSDFAGSHPRHSLELELVDFQIERFIKTFREEKGAEGTATFITQFNSSGKSFSEMVASLNGQAEITGTDIILYGLNIDEQLANYESTQQFQLVDAAAFFVAGPLGVAITRGYGFASLFAHTGEQTQIWELVSKWDFSDGVAKAQDVAFSTAKNRIALEGGIDYANSRFQDLKVAVVDPEGCAVVEQAIQGDFHNPKVDTPNFLVALAGPFMDIIEKGVGLFTDKECDPFYTGRVAPP